MHPKPDTAPGGLWKKEVSSLTTALLWLDGSLGGFHAAITLRPRRSSMKVCRIRRQWCGRMRDGKQREKHVKNQLTQAGRVAETRRRPSEQKKVNRWIATDARPCHPGHGRQRESEIRGPFCSPDAHPRTLTNKTQQPVRHHRQHGTTQLRTCHHQGKPLDGANPESASVFPGGVQE